jgi:hypothetical protein
VPGAVLRRGALRKPEVPDLCPPVKAGRGGVVLVRVVEGAVVHRIDRDIAVIAPAIARAALAAGAVKEMLFA